ncbi:MAG: hypothetical protein UW68_C0006G0022 [Candidatus Collierbacteria bacterium GW2011_GWB1_44_6]|uniref:Uncharacterized protein n=2 Tax=Candidatus Collieribacteriota TaxID=1752725 RepID=A0A0G1JQA3_9BACT|nr:MAG: hypothetical protein UV68_C0023G0014 [Candidatus Collierbacteria bacterium GW2011_GWC2_43_12]KKT73580.1 MAG: hypothetical protein UW68_C0006G0022 [Candidatus Collierbacteria bacterium GW2011_GWB1_44_6]KKT83257.1 MAG: hypothetical protein UW80_C0018G0008 [Microgenomates group bacterium GW2011_GWC1_44_9]
MTSPYKYHKSPMVYYPIIGTIVVAFLLFTDPNPYSLINLVYVSFIVLAFFLMGCAVTLATKTLYHHKVKDGVNPHKLTRDQYYWLNGQTPAKYLGKHEYTGKYVFSIAGVNDSDDPTDATYVLPGIVMEYFSEHKED